jgi:serine/threonine protein kinase
MNPRSITPPTAEELQTYSLGKCEPHRAGEIEAFLAGSPDCGAILDAAPEDDLLRHLRGAGSLPRPNAAPPSAATAPTEESTTFLEHARYRFLRKLGQGGMGAVYLAEHRIMRRRVAIKLIRARYLNNPQLVQRFQQEVRAAASLSHPHIVTAYDADSAAGTHFLVMEYVEGESLAERLTRHGPLPAPEACSYIRQAALALEFAHSRGMVHRDIKPHNLMRAGDGTVKVLDFGLARVIQESQPPEGPLTTERTVMGTADYIAPEQAQDCRTADIRADIYSLGCTLYHLLTGNVPYPGGTAITKIVKHSTASAEPLRRRGLDLPAGLSDVVEKMMAKAPADRYQTPAEVAAVLEPFTNPRRSTGAGRLLGKPILGCLVVLLLLLAAFVLLYGAVVLVLVLTLS